MTAPTQNRNPRDVESRTFQERPKQWMPPETLPEPDKQAGFSYKWVRISTLNNADPQNVAKSFREGWEPVKQEEQPKLKLLATKDGQFKDNIEIGGLVLCKIPTEFIEQRSAYYANQNNAQMEAVDNTFFRENDPRMPLFKDRKSSTSFGKG